MPTHVLSFPLTLTVLKWGLTQGLLEVLLPFGEQLL